ncbi:GntR family transcriptional regulator [Caballeronia sp. LjRoot34]|uniref:GntR family transcriptional regulator n=1 Tax=Caballeronia sp. LjRoot34 TaxID=3342325 RepID=UPI003ED0EF19
MSTNDKKTDGGADGTPGEAQSLPELAYRRIRASILSARLPPGSELRQEHLAKEFGISRVPVREAMNRLHAEGLIVLRPRRGFAVPSLTPEEIVEICDLNTLLEEHAAVLATRERTEADVQDVRKILEDMEALHLDGPDDLSTWQELAHKFHERLFASARRRRLHEMVSNLRDAVEPYMRLEMDLVEHILQSNLDHRKILDAFRARDTQAAGRLSREHAENIKRHLVTSFAAGADSVAPSRESVTEAASNAISKIKGKAIRSLVEK